MKRLWGLCGRGWRLPQAGVVARLFAFGKPRPQTPWGNRLPLTVHHELKLQRLPVNGRLVIVGDVHGCRAQLQELLDKVTFTQERDCLIFVGDLVNKGPDSPGVIDLASEYGALSVRGNHDDAALLDFSSMKNGADYRSLENSWVKNMEEKQADYLGQMPFSVSIPELRTIIVHAGLVPGLPLEKQKLVDLYQMRFLRKKWGKWIALSQKEEGSVLWAEKWDGPHHVIFGHDAVRGLQVMRYATGLDSGCVYGGQLTACIIPAGKLLHARRNADGNERRRLDLFDPTHDQLQIETVSVNGLKGR